MSMNLTVFNAQTVAELSKIQMAPHVVEAMILAVSANPNAQPPEATFKTFQVMCGHVDPDLLVAGMTECLQHVKWFPVPKEVLDACDFIEQIINERANYRKPTSYAARGKVEAKAFDVAEFKRRLLPTTKAYIERRREELRAANRLTEIDLLDEMKLCTSRLPQYRKYLEAERDESKRDYFVNMIKHYQDRLDRARAGLNGYDDDGTTKPH